MFEEFGRSALVTPAEVKKGKSIVKDCATKGLAAGLGTAGAGGLVALASVWIPGVNAVTWTGVAVASAAAECPPPSSASSWTRSTPTELSCGLGVPTRGVGLICSATRMG